MCVNGQCQSPCEERNPCGLNAECLTEGHRKLCTCPPSFTGNAEVECVRVPNTCISDSGCPSEMSCMDGICLLQCKADKNCAPNERCLGGRCMLTCRVDNDCFLGHVCLNNMCLIGCKQNTDCPTSHSCVANRCIDPCQPEHNSCGPNSNCKVLGQRAHCSCRDGFLPNPTAVVGCVRELASCVTNKQCPAGFQCDRQTFCKPVCSSDGNCLPNELCIGNVCKEICRKDSECDSDEICQGVECVKGCRGNTDCPDNQACLNNKCVGEEKCVGLR